MTDVNELLAHRVNQHDAELVEIKTVLKSIAESLSTLAVVAAHHEETRGALARAFKALDQQEARISVVEVEMPALKTTRDDVRRMTWIVLTAVAVAVLALTLK